jgi:hypothetical protein
MTIFEFDVSTSSPRRGFSSAEVRLFHHRGEVTA